MNQVSIPTIQGTSYLAGLPSSGGGVTVHSFLVARGSWRDRYQAGHETGLEESHSKSPFRGGTPEHAGWFDATNGFENRHPFVEEATEA